MKTLKEVRDSIVIERLEQFKGNRTHTAKSLGVSLRGLRDILIRLKANGVKILESSHYLKCNRNINSNLKIKKPIEVILTDMPTNEERLSHLNWILNGRRD